MDVSNSAIIQVRNTQSRVDGLIGKVLEGYQKFAAELSAYERSDLLANYNFPDISAVVEIENDNGEIVVLA